jgi:hypothetical protein
MCYLILKLKIVMTIFTSFDIWLSKGGVNMFVLVIDYFDDL